MGTVEDEKDCSDGEKEQVSTHTIEVVTKYSNGMKYDKKKNDSGSVTQIEDSTGSRYISESELNIPPKNCSSPV